MSLKPPRIYTLEEANAALPQVRKLVERIVERFHQLPELQEQARVADYKTSRPTAGPEAELEVAEDALRLERLGVALKDAQTGLIDFYSYREGELIELCWLLGEDTV